ncbi:MAG: hypothetical protein DMG32_25780 [Acidobacteria bacterium]|nr:MAG: hypothetical protein DMG32_25780 [Acidobacteriota bacterium]
MKAERTTASNSESHPGSKGAKSPVGHTPVDLLYEKGIQRTLAKLLAELDPVEILGTVVYVVLSIWGKSNALVLPFWLFIALLAGYHTLARADSQVDLSDRLVRLSTAPTPAIHAIFLGTLGQTPRS